MTTLLETKLQPPPPHPGAVDRIRLLDRLGRDSIPALVLVSAPPGFGKSTLVAQWVAALHVPADVAWVSLDPADADPVRFWTYVATAVDRAVPGAGEASLRHLADGPAGLEAATLALANGLAGTPRDLLLVLDDLHAADDPSIAAGLTFLLDHLPTRAHLVLLTRADPPLPIARLRARGQLVEVRAADLRFTPDEATAYLVDRMGLPLGADAVATLAARTEGWIAALQLAAISMRGRDDTDAFVASFAGDDRYLVDYLADEVLERQPPAIRDFLLDTSVLERLTGPLCDAVTGGEGGAAMLEALERANLFLVPLDDRRRWYRYHHLFADLLRARLVAGRASDVPRLHARASAWWEANGEPREAVRHALAAGDPERTADLVELAAHELRRTREEATLRAWLDALPDEVFDRRPVLAIAHAGALLSTGEARKVRARLDAAERWTGATPGVGGGAGGESPTVRHVSALAHLPAAIALYRAALARMAGDAGETTRQARVAFDAAGEDQPLERGAAAGILALAYWSDGELDAAHASWSMAVADLERAGHRADMLGGFLAMGEIRATQGRLAEAGRTFERGLRVGTAASPPLRGTADMHVALAELALDRHDLADASAHLDAATALGEAAGLPQHPWRLRAAAAGLRAASGDADGALALLDEAAAVYTPDFFPETRPIAAIRARLRLGAGAHGDALAWAVEAGVRADDPPAFLGEYGAVTLAAALIASAVADGRKADASAAAARIDDLLAAATDGGRARSVVALTALRAAASAATGDREGAAARMDRALGIAEQEAVIRPFLELGSPLAPLVRDAARRTGSPFAARVAGAIDGLAAARSASAVSPPPPASAAPSATTPAATRSAVEPLSERELEVLRLLASDLDGPEIASQLFVSLNTLRTHTKHIFAKLGVNSRRAAITRATELGLLARR